MHKGHHFCNISVVNVTLRLTDRNNHEKGTNTEKSEQLYYYTTHSHCSK